MKRRDFIAGLGGAVAYLLAAKRQQVERVRRVGFLLPRDDQTQRNGFEALRGELANLGWVEGRNLQIYLRFGGADADRFRSYAAELISLAPDVLVTVTGAMTIAAQRQTQVIPIVFLAVGDPVASGVVRNIARPEGNTTGVTNLFDSIAGKWVELLKEAVPGIACVGSVYSAQVVVPGAAGYGYLLSIEAAAHALGVQAIRIPYRDAIDILRSIDAFAVASNGGLIVVPPGPTDENRKMIQRFTAEHRLPDIYSMSGFVAEGGLMSYGSSNVDLARRGSSLVDRILRGAKPGDLPVEFPSRFELVINLKTARALGLSIPLSLLARADEVIE
jgi:putative tryptophan/tyrosine transport system substrate-binding protein